MEFVEPIYTKLTECQDCYKCLRQCPVKAIKIHEGHACIEPDLCIMCGHCVQVCPVGAKMVRSDLERAKMLLKIKPKVFVSLAPSYVTEFDNLSSTQIIQGLKQLGFHGVSETALGAQELSATVTDKMAKGERKIYISSACPTVVELIKKYHPDCAPYVTDMHSPVLVHTKLLRQEYGQDIGIVFIGPCISKKAEADLYGEQLNIALTFEELRQWWQDMNITPEELHLDPAETFVPYAAEEGAMYPIDGGMVAGVKANCTINDIQYMSFSGIDNIQKVLMDLDKIPLQSPLFIELLACEGGCVNGPKTSTQGKTTAKRYKILQETDYAEAHFPRKPSVDASTQWQIEPITRKHHDESEIRNALARIGKHCKQDELNCGGCGYDSCRECAVAMIEGRAEPSMCVSYMRQLAHKKAAALLRTIPSGVVIVGEDLRIVECNRRFSDIMGSNNVLAYDAKPGMEGAYLSKVVPFHKMFSSVLSTGIESVEKDVKLNTAILNVTVFTIEPHRIVGGIIRDITEPAVQKERIIKKAKQVIEQNLSTVQQIAYLLGENAAESEVILNSIVNSFSVEPAAKPEE